MDTKQCKCSGTMHYSANMDDPFPRGADRAPYWQCEQCGAILEEINTKHTPGPYKATRDNSHLRLLQYDIYADNGRGKLIAEVLGDNARANAALFVAAPKLLAALEQIANGTFTFEELRQGRSLAIENAARAAIAATTPAAPESSGRS